MSQFFDRELSWLSFNERVLQEAEDPKNPLFERIKFLAIYSSNLDEFSRVRVALYQQMARVDEKKGLGNKNERLLASIREKVIPQLDRFGEIFFNKIMTELKDEGYRLVSHGQLELHQKEFVEKEFEKLIMEYCVPLELNSDDEPPFLENKGLYFFLRATDKDKPRIEKYYFLRVPSNEMPRFIEIPKKGDRNTLIILDELVKYFFPKIFPNDIVRMCYEIKMSRDADLYLDDEQGINLLERVKSALPKRYKGAPSRLLYDSAISKAHLKMIRKSLGLKKTEMVPGGAVHNFSDLFSFPISNDPKYFYPNQESLSIPKFDGEESIIASIKKGDVLGNFPYQDYGSVVRFVEEASNDPLVKSIAITLYRVASDSAICKALIKAAESGKDVFVFNEVKARFDEESNIYWGERLQKAGAKVQYSFEDLKVHSKVCLVRREEQEPGYYAYLGTGNFNEKTAAIYCDHGLFTSDLQIGKDLESLFEFLRSNKHPEGFDKLLVAPFNLREEFVRLVENEIQIAKRGGEGKMILKMNSLEDKEMIKKLYEASQAGVKIKLVIRGICCLIPGKQGLSENIEAISVVGRFLEHARIYWFGNDGDPCLYLASSDWMKRNLSKRVEVAFPIEIPEHYEELMKLIELQLSDNVKGRILNVDQSNLYFQKEGNLTNSQEDFYKYLSEK